MTLLTGRKSTHHLTAPDFFVTGTKGDDQGDLEGSITSS